MKLVGLIGPENVTATWETGAFLAVGETFWTVTFRWEESIVHEVEAEPAPGSPRPSATPTAVTVRA